MDITMPNMDGLEALKAIRGKDSNANVVMEANAWALRLEREDGQSRDYFRPLSLCRKPKEKATFPSLTDEQKAVIENIWFDKRFAANLGTIEMLYEKFEDIAGGRGWDEYPSVKTVARYVKHLMSRKGAESARYLAANGTREWKNKKMLKGKRDATSLEVMEYVIGDEHTFDLWVQWTAPNGKIKAVRPKLVAWIDMKSRAIIGDVLCVDANSQTLKESLVKMIYSSPGGVPKILHVDNGKDYTARSMTGQSRKQRSIDFGFDAETVGFYQSIGIQEVGRSLPYQPWDKPIERFFNTVCLKFSRWFDSYVGTLTGSKTYAKRQKDVDAMLERGELLTMDEFFDVWTEWKNTKYHAREHRGLKDAGEKWVTPADMFANGPRYEKAAPPREYAAMLLMVIRISEGEASFNSEIQNDPIDPESCSFQEEWIDFYDDEGKVPPDFSDPRFIFVGANDPSLGKNKKSDTSFIGALAKDLKTGYMYILIADIAKRKPDQIITDAIENSRRLQRDYKRPYYQFGVETVQFQYYFAEIMRQKSAEVGEYLPIVEINSVQNKDARIQSLQPFVKNGYLKFSRKHKTLLKQLLEYPMGKNDDGPDGLQMMVKLGLDVKVGMKVEYKSAIARALRFRRGAY